MTSLARELEAACIAARQAGEVLRKEQRMPGGPRGSHGKAPADVEAERVIHRVLSKAFPDYGFIGEELPELKREAKDAERSIWLVDPNDGTAAFLRGWRGNSVSIGMIRNGVPVLGVVFAPCAPDDDGDFFSWAEGMPAILRNGVEQEPLSDDALHAGDTLALSQAADRRPRVHAQLSQPARYQPIPSIAYRLALAACGDYAAALSLHGPDNYDVGAGHALLRGAGGAMLNEEGKEWRYNELGDLAVGGLCFGGRHAACADLCKRDWDPARYSPPVSHGEFDPRGLQPGLAVADVELLDRARGTLLGLLCGDSLGALAEGMSAAEASELFPDGIPTMRENAELRMPAGGLSDDGEMAIALARSIARCERYDPAHALRAYAHWYRTHPPIVGTTTSRALEAAHLALGPNDSAWPDEAARARPVVMEIVGEAAANESISNGSLMRCAPLGLLGTFADFDDLWRWCSEDASLTHPNPVCAHAGFALCAGIAIALRSPGMDPLALLKDVRLLLEERSADESVIAALDAARKGGIKADRDVSKDGAIVALHNAFAQALRADSAHQGITASVMLGGDADTNAAVAGALLGAIFGVRSLRDNWVQAIITARPIGDAYNERPMSAWAVDAMSLVERVIVAGKALAE